MARYPYARRRGVPKFMAAVAAFVVSGGGYLADTGTAEAISCDGNTITANVAVLDSPTVFNRLGAQNPNWITYALLRDVVEATPDGDGILQPGRVCTDPDANCVEGNVMLRPDKRPRPLVVRSVAGSCLTVNFINLLEPVVPPAPNQAQQGQDTVGTLPNGDPFPGLFNDDFVADRCASFHAQGVELVNTMTDDGSQVGVNPGAGAIAAGQCGSGLVAPGGSITYNLYTPKEGTFTVNSYGATLGGEANSGNLGIGMFAQVNVEPVGARIYRSQVTEEELRLATTNTTAAGQPIINYEATYPLGPPWNAEGKAGLPVLNMLCNAAAVANGACIADELVHSDINAIIAGPNTNGTFPPSTYPLESVGKNVPSLPNRLEPFREFSSIFHDEQANSQVFPNWYQDPVLNYTLAGVKDQFMINYGSGGIGSEIIANRLRTGPMHDCTDCAYEEFFLASQTVGDPGLLVNFPANTGIEACSPRNIAAGPTVPNSCWRNANLSNGPIDGNYALYQEDPSNVHHSYTGDFVKFRNIHAGAFEQHIFHLHNHQWLFNPNDDNANYMDAQEIMPGSGHTYELTNGGAGNRNKTAGDAIFHCHFYPHFAQGMWYHIRIQDMFETGSLLAVSDNETGFHTERYGLRSGQPAAQARALPDGELPDGVPIPAIVPLPGKAMPMMPAPVHVVAVDRGNHSLAGGRTPPDPNNPTPDSSQAVVDYGEVAGPDGVLHDDPNTPADESADNVSPGFPFWLAGNECGVAGATATNCPMGTVGQRMPTPPLDMLTETGATASGFNPAQAGGWDGGLPRHNLLGYSAGSASLDTNNRLDFSKIVEMAQPVFFPETGTDMEKVSMAYNAIRCRDTFLADGTSANCDVNDTGGFILNGADPAPGSPFNDPCIDDAGAPLTAGFEGSWFDGDGDPATLKTKGGSSFHSGDPRTYKVANVQIDAVFNKVGYHYPQERIIALWEDITPTVLKERPPEPLVMRFNTFDCGKILHTNLVPAEFEVDDFQVRTPTDIIGQHIHLPKWDLTTNDGAANGWNYEDGTLSPEMVVERIHAIDLYNIKVQACIDSGVPDGPDCILAPGVVPGTLGPIDLNGLLPVATLPNPCNDQDPLCGTPAELTDLTPVANPDLIAVLGDNNPQAGVGLYDGARTTIQRILVDPVVNVEGVDRGLGLTFSHDHYGPSTFQQIGLYSTILAEPAGSSWVHNESGVPLGTRDDGGPTTWQAAILPPGNAVGTVQSHLIPDHREFYFEMSDFQHAYEAGVFIGANTDGVPLHTTIVQPDVFDATVALATGELAGSWRKTVNPPLKVRAVGAVDGAVGAGGPNVVKAEPFCPGDGGVANENNPAGLTPRPCAEAINISHSSMFVVNYRNEPVGLRVFDPNAIGPDGVQGAQAAGQAGDLALAFSSTVNRAINQLNTSFGDMPATYNIPAAHCQGNTGDGINCDRRRGDPITPIMRAYERDNVKVKIQVGATEEQHQATIHGMKWLAQGSGFGRSPNSGWRNFQSHGISEQFSLQIPINRSPQQVGDTVDYLYATDATRDGIWLGSWGLLRSYAEPRVDLYQLPENPAGATTIVNEGNFSGVCPNDAFVRSYSVTAVLANEILPNAIDINGDAVPDIQIPPNENPTDNAGGPLNPEGGTLVYNRRGTEVLPRDVGGINFPGGKGPLNDPTAIMYVRTEDMVNPNRPEAGLLPGAPVEPLVLRANAGDCIEVNLRNRLPPNQDAPDLAGWQDMMWVVNRELFQPVRGNEMHFFNNNLVRPSSRVGLHAQLVEYDASRDDGLAVGQNPPGVAGAIQPNRQKTYRWYAGDVTAVPVSPGSSNVNLVATPIEFGGTNLLSADRVKQPQKGLFGALVIEPEGAMWPDALADLDDVPDGQGNAAALRKTRAQVDVSSPAVVVAGTTIAGGDYREALAIGHKITNLRWVDGTAIANVNQDELGREGAEDSGHAGFNYGMEPSWFRFQLPPDVPFGNAGTQNTYGSIPNAHAMYANPLVANAIHPNFIPAITDVSEEGDPQTPVFRATAGEPTRMHVLNGASADRDGTFMLHGHVWQRDPFVCTGTSQDDLVTLPGRCDPDAVASQALGLNPQAKYMGGEEGMGHAYGHWPILLDAAGGGNAATSLGCTAATPCDFLYRDYAPNGNRNGQFGILRVE